MTSIIEEIQRTALDSSTPLSDLLRKARVVASKLNQDQPLAWVEAELNGYEADVPDYRKLHGQLKVRNPYHGWQPFLIEDPEMQRVVCERSIQSPVRELEHFVSSKGDMVMPLSDEQSGILCQSAGAPTLPVAVFMPKNGAIRILDIVRTKILDWSLSLQAAGIEGEGLSFSPAEKAVANNPSVTYNIGRIGNFSGNLGGNVGRDVHSSSSQQTDAQLRKVANLIEQIRATEGQLGLTPSAEKEMRAYIESLHLEINKPQPEVGKVSGLLKSVKTIAESVAENVIAAGIIAIAGSIHL